MLAGIIYVDTCYLWGQDNIKFIKSAKYTGDIGKYKNIRIKIDNFRVFLLEQTNKGGRLYGCTEFCEVVFKRHIRPNVRAVPQFFLGYYKIIRQVFDLTVNLICYHDLKVYIRIMLCQ